VDDPGDLAVIRKSPNPALREHEIAVDHDLEHAILALDQRDSSSEFCFQLGRQPGGPWPVVSNPAVFD
jgi:hypothetical protein